MAYCTLSGEIIFLTPWSYLNFGSQSIRLSRVTSLRPEITRVITQLEQKLHCSFFFVFHWWQFQKSQKSFIEKIYLWEAKFDLPHLHLGRRLWPRSSGRTLLLWLFLHCRVPRFDNKQVLLGAIETRTWSDFELSYFFVTGITWHFWFYVYVPYYCFNYH